MSHGDSARAGAYFKVDITGVTIHKWLRAQATNAVGIDQ